MSRNPLVSVIVPAFNAAPFLRETLDSLLQQTYPHVELLVFDDASTDATPDIIASYGDALHAFRQATNRGIYNNANDGIAKARGEFIAIYHADDVYDTTIVEREVDFLKHHCHAGAVFCLDIFVDATNREYGRLTLPPELASRAVLKYGEVLDALLRYKNRFLMCPGAMVRADVYRAVGTYDQETFRNTADLDMWLRIARRYPLGLLHEYLFRYRHFHGNSSHHYHHLRTAPENFFRIVDHYLAEIDPATVDQSALEAYEGHRAEDRLRNVVSHYIRGNLPAARTVLRELTVKAFMKGHTIQRWRLLVVLFAFRFLARLPRLAFVSRAFHRRWYEKVSPLGGGGR